MEEEPASPRENKADALLALVKGPLAASAARLSAHSRAVPAGRDFHFYRNFEQFGSPAREVAARSGVLLTSIGSSEIVCGVGKHEDESEHAGLPEDLDDAHDWVVSVNDEILERFNASMDEFRSLREDEERGTVADRVATMEAGGFQIVQGKKSKKNKKNGGVEDGVEVGGVLGVKVASRDKKTSGPRSQVPFHIPTIPRPQDAFKILVNNSNQPFEHVWLERSKDGSQFVHPLEKLSVLDFIDGNVGEDEPMKPPPLEDTPFKFVEDVKGLKELAAKLRAVNEFSVDLEHNQYRSFQGLTCLMQISTRTEDFIVDTLKLRIHVGPHLREVFKDPSKRKVMHGADRDILWLQRDFGIYVCNLFDTGQASRVMQLERNSLEYLLQYFCGVTANKEYQQADWRLRPLPEEMIKYAREDTHYLLFMYDVMRRQLLSGSSNHELSDSLLAEVYRRSSDICMQLYEKELLTDTSFLRIYGLSEADFNSQQIAIVAGLWEWRDCISRAEDESTGYILPNKALLEIARRMPLTSGALRQLVKSKHPYVERNLSTVVAVIRNAVTNAAAFQPIVDRLKQATETPHGGAEEQAAAAAAAPALMTSTLPLPSSAAETPQRGTGESTMASTMAAAVFVEKKEKPAGAFGALFGGSAVKRKVTHLVNGGRVQGGAEAKLEQIRASVALPFHSFMGGAAVAQPPETMDNCREEPPSAAAATITIAAAGEQLGDVIPLASSPDEMPERNGGEENEEEPPSLPAAERGSAGCGTSPEWEPFDYAAARKEVRFGGRREEAKEPAAEAESGGGPPSGRRRGGGGADESDLSAPRRCQAYPPSGNRSATFH